MVVWSVVEVGYMRDIDNDHGWREEDRLGNARNGKVRPSCESGPCQSTAARQPGPNVVECTVLKSQCSWKLAKA